MFLAGGRTIRRQKTEDRRQKTEDRGGWLGKQISKKYILAVEDSEFFGTLVKNEVESTGRYTVTWVKTLAEAKKVVLYGGIDFFAAILDFNIPDAPQGEVIPFVAEQAIPSVVYTDAIDSRVREMVWSHKVVDYIVKGSPDSAAYITSILDRLEKNRNIGVLVVDDSKFFNKVISDLLRVQLLQVHQADSGAEALDILAEHPDIKMMITDHDMPNMVGIELTALVRRQFSKDDLAIIGISANGDQVMSAQFIKAGANDFIIKQSFATEEFYCRVSNLLESIERIAYIRETAIRDFLTGLYNRRYFFENGQEMLAAAKSDNVPVTCAMLDIDYFKKVNDTYGHEVGDLVLIEVAAFLKSQMKESDLVARIGGEEFCVLAVNMSQTKMIKVFKDLRLGVENLAISSDDEAEPIKVTISIGVTSKFLEPLEEMVKVADQALYWAKEDGRNQVKIV